MIDLKSAGRGAVFRALNAGATGQLVDVFTEVPQGTQPPYVEIGSIMATNVSAKRDDRRQELLVEVWAIHRGEARGPLLTVMNAIEQDLDGQPITADGAALRPPRFVSGLASDADDDGVTYGGVTHFTIEAQPA